MTNTPIISKSKYLAGLQCPKRLWVEYNDRQLIPEADEQTQAIFDQGTEVGTLAKQLFPGGLEVTGPHTEFDALVRNTTGLLGLRKPLFEAAFRFRSAFVRVDVLAPIAGGVWDLIEVKSSGEVKGCLPRRRSLPVFCLHRRRDSDSQMSRDACKQGRRPLRSG